MKVRSNVRRTSVEVDEAVLEPLYRHPPADDPLEMPHHNQLNQEDQKTIGMSMLEKGQIAQSGRQEQTWEEHRTEHEYARHAR